MYAYYYYPPARSLRVRLFGLNRSGDLLQDAGILQMTYHEYASNIAVYILCSNNQYDSSSK